MRNWARLKVSFNCDDPPNIDQVYTCLRRAYRIGYCGLYQLEDSVCLYIQTTTKNARMVPAKVFRLCAPFGAKEPVIPFSYREGIILSEKGQFRAAGGSRLKGKQVATSTIVNNTTNNIHNGDQINQVFNDNREIHIHIHALGSEDVSHIQMEQFKSLFEGSTDDVIRQMKEITSPQNYHRFVETAWQGLRNNLYAKKCSDKAMENTGGSSSSHSAKEKTPHQDARVALLDPDLFEGDKAIEDAGGSASSGLAEEKTVDQAVGAALPIL